jgi:hypothetical protein
MHEHSKYIDIRFHFLHDLTRDVVVELRHCSTQEQITYIMTKSLKLDIFLKQVIGCVRGTRTKLKVLLGRHC